MRMIKVESIEGIDMRITRDDLENPLLLNRLWNLKVTQAQSKIAELQALFKSLGFTVVNIPDVRHPNELYSVDDVLKALFLGVIGRTKAM